MFSFAPPSREIEPFPDHTPDMPANGCADWAIDAEEKNGNPKTATTASRRLIDSNKIIVPHIVTNPRNVAQKSGSLTLQKREGSNSPPQIRINFDQYGAGVKINRL